MRRIIILMILGILISSFIVYSAEKNELSTEDIKKGVELEKNKIYTVGNNIDIVTTTRTGKIKLKDGEYILFKDEDTRFGADPVTTIRFDKETKDVKIEYLQLGNRFYIECKKQPCDIKLNSIKVENFNTISSKPESPNNPGYNEFLIDKILIKGFDLKSIRHTDQGWSINDILIKGAKDKIHAYLIWDKEEGQNFIIDGSISIYNIKKISDDNFIEIDKNNNQLKIKGINADLPKDSPFSIIQITAPKEAESTLNIKEQKSEKATSQLEEPKSLKVTAEKGTDIKIKATTTDNGEEVFIIQGTKYKVNDFFEARDKKHYIKRNAWEQIKGETGNLGFIVGEPSLEDLITNGKNYDDYVRATSGRVIYGWAKNLPAKLLDKNGKATKFRGRKDFEERVQSYISKIDEEGIANEIKSKGIEIKYAIEKVTVKATPSTQGVQSLVPTITPSPQKITSTSSPEITIFNDPEKVNEILNDPETIKKMVGEKNAEMIQKTGEAIDLTMDLLLGIIKDLIPSSSWSSWKPFTQENNLNVIKQGMRIMRKNNVKPAIIKKIDQKLGVVYLEDGSTIAKEGITAYAENLQTKK